MITHRHIAKASFTLSLLFCKSSAFTTHLPSSQPNKDAWTHQDSCHLRCCLGDLGRHPLPFKVQRSTLQLFPPTPIGCRKEQTSGNINGKAMAEAGFVVVAFDASFQALRAVCHASLRTPNSVSPISVTSLTTFKNCTSMPTALVSSALAEVVATRSIQA